MSMLACLSLASEGSSLTILDRRGGPSLEYSKAATTAAWSEKLSVQLAVQALRFKYAFENKTLSIVEKISEFGLRQVYECVFFPTIYQI